MEFIPRKGTKTRRLKEKIMSKKPWIYSMSAGEGKTARRHDRCLQKASRFA